MAENRTQKVLPAPMPKPSPTSSKPRLIGLDLLRLLAVALVLGRHMMPPPDTWPTAIRLPLLTWMRGGWVGVDLFFVLSGFLVSGLLFKEYKRRNSLGIWRFYIRRGWRIYPPFFALIAVTVSVLLIAKRPIPALSLASELVFLQSYWPGMWAHTWSLAVEEHFYFFLPLVLASILARRKRSPAPLRPILWLAAGLAVSSLALRLGMWLSSPAYTHYRFLFPSHLRFDSLFFGVAISYLYHFHSEAFVRLLSPWRRALILVGALVLAPAFVFQLETTPFIFTLGLSTFYVGSGMMLVGVILTPIPRNRLVNLLAAGGAHSYSIYLWHLPVLYWGVPLVLRALGIPPAPGTWIAMYFVGSFLFGIGMAKVVEVPVLRLRDRWFPSRSAGAVLPQRHTAMTRDTSRSDGPPAPEGDIIPRRRRSPP